MPEITQADQATYIAVNFLKRYYYWVRPMAAKKTNGAWEVRLDVGVTKQAITRLEIDGSTGSITAYELPVPPEKGFV